MLIIISLIIFSLAFGRAYYPNAFNLKEAMAGEIVGSLIGVGGLILGLGLERFLTRRKEKEDEQREVKKILEVITSELVNIALGMIAFRDILKAAIGTAEAGENLPESYDLTVYLSRPMPFTDSLGKEILLLSEKQVEALFVLKHNLQLMDKEIQEVSQFRRTFNRMTAKKLLASLHHNMELLAEAFEKVKPERKLEFSGKEPELASVILRNLAQKE